MKFPAVIDLGTNTFHLLIGDDNGKVKFKKRIHVLLGKDRSKDERIDQKAITRAVDAIADFKNIVNRYNADPVIAIATEGFRSGVNSGELIDAIKAKTGIEVEVISGEMEAEFIYLGVRQTINVTDEKILIMDVGGGSVEFVIADQGGVIEKYSFRTGAAYLLKKIKPSDPITQEEVEATRAYLNSVFRPLFRSLEIHQPAILAGSSGSFETFAEILAAKNNETLLLESVHSYEIPPSSFREIYSSLIAGNRRQRLMIPGMLEMRVDMIVLASIMIDLIIEKSEINSIIMSKFALKEGVLWAHLNRQTT